MRPDLVRRASGTSTARLALFLLVGGSVIGAVLLVLIAGGVSGIARAIIIAILAPILVVSVLILWRSAQAIAQVSTRRRRTIEELRRRGIIGMLSLSPLAASWAERIGRKLILPAGIHLLTIDPESAATADGQMRLRIFYDLLGIVPPTGETLPLPARSTLALVEPNGDVHIWDLAALLQRADAGDDTAREDLLELELHVQQRAMDEAVRGEGTGNR